MSGLSGEARELLRAPNIGHLGTVLADGGPHVVPIWLGVHEGRLVFITGPSTVKARNLARDARVSISVVHHERWTTMAHVRGRAVDRLEGDAAWAVVDEISRSYTGQDYPRDDERIAYAVEIDRLTLRSFG